MTAKSKKKKVDFSVRPRAAKEQLPANADEWVREGQGAVGPQKRLTLNLPAALHTAFKGRCVLEGVTIQDKVQALIERELAPQPTPEAG
jgi:ParG